MDITYICICLQVVGIFVGFSMILFVAPAIFLAGHALFSVLKFQKNKFMIYTYLQLVTVFAGCSGPVGGFTLFL